MPKTLTQIQKQIAKLQKEADAIKAREMMGVIERIRDAIGHYGLTVEHLFGVKAPKALAKKKAKSAGPRGTSESVGTRPSAAKGTKAAIKYRDAHGNSWSGRGSQPRWLRFAIEDGASLSDFEVKAK